jgi:hypothetical protein
MNVELLTTGARQWADFLEHTEHDFYHLPSYVEFCAANDGGTACAAHVDDHGRSLLLPLILRPVPPFRRQRHSRDATSPYGYPGPLVRCEPAAQVDGFLSAAVAAIVERLRHDEIVSLFVRSHPLLSPPLEVDCATVVTHGRTVSVDLTRTSDELWRQTAKGHRTEIAKAEREGVGVRFDETFEHLPAFASMYRDTMARRHAAPDYHFPDAYFAGLQRALSTRLRLGVVEIDGAFAAGGLFVFTGGLVEYHLSATDARFERQRPTKLLLHFVRTWAAARGLTRFHLGGGVGGHEDTLFAFKAGFSPDRQPFQTLRAVCDEEAYGELVRSAAPDATPDAALDDRAGFFPAYRRKA